METDTTTDVVAETADSDTDDVVSDAATSEEETQGKDWAAEAAKWKAMARKHEKDAKTNADKASKFDQVEAKNKTESEKLAEAKAKAEQDATDARAEAARLTAAIKHGLTEDDLELLGTGTPDEITERAAKLAKRIKSATPKPDFGGGQRGGDINGVKQWSKSDLDGKTSVDIEQARKAGHLDRLMGKTN